MMLQEFLDDCNAIPDGSLKRMGQRGIAKMAAEVIDCDELSKSANDFLVANDKFDYELERKLTLYVC